MVVAVIFVKQADNGNAPRALVTSLVEISEGSYDTDVLLRCHEILFLVSYTKDLYVRVRHVELIPTHTITLVVHQCLILSRVREDKTLRVLCSIQLENM